MTERHEPIKCAECGTLIDDTAADNSDSRVPCSTCGSTKRAYMASIVDTLALHDGIGLKAKRPDQKKPFIEELSMPSYSYSRKKYVHRLRVIDRDNDRYFEKITDYETSEIIHNCEEPLSIHQGHGDAKRKGEKG